MTGLPPGIRAMRLRSQGQVTDGDTTYMLIDPQRGSASAAWLSLATHLQDEASVRVVMPPSGAAADRLDAALALPRSPRRKSTCTMLCLLINRPGRARLLLDAGLVKPRQQPGILVLEDEGWAGTKAAQLTPLGRHVRELTSKLALIGRK